MISGEYPELDRTITAEEYETACGEFRELGLGGFFQQDESISESLFLPLMAADWRKQNNENVLSIAGTDPTGGAGIQTDLKTFEAHGVYGMAVISAVVAQNTFHVTGMQAMPADLVGRQIDCVFEDIRPDAVKIGMLYDKEIIHKTAECLCAHSAKKYRARSGHDVIERSDAAAPGRRRNAHP